MPKLSCYPSCDYSGLFGAVKLSICYVTINTGFVTTGYTY